MTIISSPTGIDAIKFICCQLTRFQLFLQSAYTSGNLGKLYNEGDTVPFRATVTGAKTPSPIFLGADRTNQRNSVPCPDPSNDEVCQVVFKD